MRAFLVGSLVLATSATAQMQEDRLTASNSIQSDILGYDLGFDGSTILAGAPFGTYSGVQQPGRAFVYELQGGAWQQVQELRPPVLQANAWFGATLDLDGDVLVCAASGEDAPDSNSGAVYIFERNAGSWQIQPKITASDGGVDHRFGFSVAIRGTRMLVGAPGFPANGAFSGAVYVFDKIGGVWTETGKLTASDGVAFDIFGSDVALGDDVAVIGARDVHHSDLDDAGAAYIFRYSNGSWTEEARLIAEEPSGDSYFGVAVALQGDRVVVGAERHNHDGLDQAGGAYVFERTGGQWNQTAALVAPDANAFARFGCGVTLDGDTVGVGAHLSDADMRVGTAYLYRYGSEWTYDTSLNASDSGNTNFGWRIEIVGDRAAITGPFYQLNRGAVYVFTDVAPCPADWNGDGLLNTTDFLDYLNDYNLVRGAQPWIFGNPDLTPPDNVLNTADFLAYLNLYVGGC